LSVKLCFAAFTKVLKACSVQRTSQKSLCSAILSTINEEYGDSIATDDTLISRLLSCKDNLSPACVIEPAQTTTRDVVAMAMGTKVLPMLDREKLPLAILALRDMVLSSVSEDTLCMGNFNRIDLANQTSFNPVEFFADCLLYVVISVQNKDGADTIKQVTDEYIKSFDPLRATILIETVRHITPVELPKTLEIDDFEVVFREVKHNGLIACNNQSTARLFCLDISDSSFDYAALSDYLLDCLGMYVYSRTQMKEFEQARKLRSVGVRALRLMQENGAPDEKGTGNELGEMLLYAFMENGLSAPKLLSKVEIEATASRFRSKSDAVHLLKREVNGQTKYQLVFGTSCIQGDVQKAIDSAFDTIVSIKQGKAKERQMVEATLFNQTFDNATTEQLRQILIPSKMKQSSPDMAFGVFVGYSLDLKCDNNDAFRKQAMAKMETDIQASIPYLTSKITELGLGMHSFYFYFLPLNDAENDKKQIMNDLLGGRSE